VGFRSRRTHPYWRRRVIVVRTVRRRHGQKWVPRKEFMKLTLLIALLLVAAFLAYTVRNRRAARAAEEAAALARAKAAAARRNRVPDVSNNLKGVTASQTMEPYRAPGVAPRAGNEDGRVA
jgi:hypothetical protein